MNSPAAVLVATDLKKSYGGVQALRGLSLEVVAGEIHAVLGENGAGKSTLMKILAGAERLTSGSIALDGVEVEIRDTRMAESAGIGIVHQELSLFPDRSVLANLMVGQEKTRFGLISPAAMRESVRDVAEVFGLTDHLRDRLATLPLGKQQLVELARVLLRDPRVLILDEPNSALSEEETAVLFGILRDLRERGTAILYVSHRLEEVFDLCDRVSVVRSGQRVLTASVAGLSLGEVVLAMTGSAQGQNFPPLPPAPPDGASPALTLAGLRVRETVRGVDLEVRRSEILGLVGLDGAGVSTLLATLFGVVRTKSGEIVMHDGGKAPRSPGDAVRRGVSLVPADRKTHGLMLQRSMTENILHVTRGATSSTPAFISRRRSNMAADARASSLMVTYESVVQPVSGLSGGNQQKVVLAKWLEAEPEVFLLDDPTRGVDVGGKYEIHQIIASLAEQGGTVIFRSSDLAEVLGMSHRVAVFRRGVVVATVASKDTSKPELLAIMNGGGQEGLNAERPADQQGSR